MRPRGSHVQGSEAWTIRRMEQLAWLAHARETAGLRLVDRALVARGAGRAQAIAEAQQEQREANRAWLISVMVLLGGAW